MHPAIAKHVGRETTLEAFDHTWTLRRWDLSVWDEFLAWARTILPDPLEESERSVKRLGMQEWELRNTLAGLTGDAKTRVEAELKHFADMQTHFAKIGLDKAASYLSLNSPEIDSLLNSPRGSARALWLLLKDGNEGVDEDDAFAIVQAVSQKQLEEAFRIASGRSTTPPKNELSPAA